MAVVNVKDKLKQLVRQMWPLFATTAAYAMNTFASEALSGFSPFQLVFLRNPLDLTSLSFPKVDTISVNYQEYYNLLLARAQMIFIGMENSSSPRI